MTEKEKLYINGAMMAVAKLIEKGSSMYAEFERDENNHIKDVKKCDWMEILEYLRRLKGEEK